MYEARPTTKKNQCRTVTCACLCAHERLSWHYRFARERECNSTDTARHGTARLLHESIVRIDRFACASPSETFVFERLASEFREKRISSTVRLFQLDRCQYLNFTHLSLVAFPQSAKFEASELCATFVQTLLAIHFFTLTSYSSSWALQYDRHNSLLLRFQRKQQPNFIFVLRQLTSNFTLQLNYQGNLICWIGLQSTVRTHKNNRVIQLFDVSFWSEQTPINMSTLEKLIRKIPDGHLHTILPIMAQFDNETQNFNQIHIRKSLKRYIPEIVFVYVLISMLGIIANSWMTFAVVRHIRTSVEQHSKSLKVTYHYLLINCTNDIVIKCLIVLPFSFVILVSLHWTVRLGLVPYFPDRARHLVLLDICHVRHALLLSISNGNSHR